MSRTFGTEISGNRRASQELSNDQRAAILAAVDTGLSKTKVADLYYMNRTTIYNIIYRF